MKYHVAEDKSHKADTAIVDRATTATTFDRPEIAAPMRPADSSDKVDVVNQRLANFCAVRSTTKSEHGNIRAEKRDAKNGERAYTIQQSAIHDTLQSSHFAAGKTSERVIDPNSSWRDLGKMYRSERNGGAIEFAARDDLDVASHYRCYTSPRHCYRLPPQRTKRPLMGLCASNRYISVPTRTMVGFAPKNSKPPIKEPNAPEKHEKDEKKDRKEKKKPIIRTDGESVDSSENRAEMVADDNPRSDPDAAFRYEWGVKLAEEQPAAEAANDNDKFAEKGQLYVTKQLWGVNLKQPKSDIAPSRTASSGRGAGEPRNASSIFESGDTTANEAKIGTVPAPDDSAKKSDASSLKGTTAEYLSTPSRQAGSSADFITTQQDSDDDANSYLSSEELRRIMRTSPNMLKETIVVDDEYNVPKGAGLNAEIAAWQNLMMRSIPDIKNSLPTDNAEDMETMSIRPEAPQAKLDVQVVRPTKDNLKEKNVEHSDSKRTPKFTEIKGIRSPRKPDDYPISKKLHTMSTQIRYVHRHTDSIVQRNIESLSSNFVPINRTTQTKYPKFASAFSTNSEDSTPEKMIDEVSKQQINSKWENEGKSNDPNSNNTLNSDRSLLPAEPRTFSSRDQEQADTDFAKTLDVIADKEMEISMNQLQSTDRKKTAHLSDSIVSSGLTKKDKLRYKDEDMENEIERLEESYSNYTDFNNSLIDRGSVKLDANKSVKKDSSDDNTTFDSNAKDVDDDSSKEYIIDGNYVRLPGDPYPYSRENLDKWRVPRSRNLVYKPWKRETSLSSDSPTVVRSTLRNANDAYANAAGEPRDSHAADAVIETSGSSGDGGAREKTGLANKFYVSSQDQRVVSDCLRGDAANALGLRQWTEAFSRLDVGKINEAARSGDNARYE